MAIFWQRFCDPLFALTQSPYICRQVGENLTTFAIIPSRFDDSPMASPNLTRANHPHVPRSNWTSSYPSSSSSSSSDDEDEDDDRDQRVKNVAVRLSGIVRAASADLLLTTTGMYVSSIRTFTYLCLIVLTPVSLSSMALSNKKVNRYLGC
jgi:hypothetical protein